MQGNNSPTPEEVGAVLTEMLHTADMAVLTKRIVYRAISAHFSFSDGQLTPYKPHLKRVLDDFFKEKYGPLQKQKLAAPSAPMPAATAPSPSGTTSISTPSTQIIKLNSNIPVTDAHSKRNRPHGENYGGVGTGKNGNGFSMNGIKASLQPHQVKAANNIRGNIAANALGSNGDKVNGNGLKERNGGSNGLNRPRHSYANGNGIVNNNSNANGNGSAYAYANGSGSAYPNGNAANGGANENGNSAYKNKGRARKSYYHDPEESESEAEGQREDSDGSEYDPDHDDNFESDEEAEAKKLSRKLTGTAILNESGEKPTTLRVFERASILAGPLADFMSELVSSRQNVVKKVHEYVKKHNLRDPADKFYVICDPLLKNLLSVDRFTTMSLNSLLNDLLYNAEEVGDDRYDKLIEDFNTLELKIKKEKHEQDKKLGRVKKRRKRNRRNSDELDELLDGTSDGKRKRTKTGIYKEYTISEELQKVCGVSKKLTRMDTIRLIWDYIKGNGLHVKERKEIKFDANLKNVFGDRETMKYVDIFRDLNKHLFSEDR